MNLVERLLAVDKGEFDKIETKKLKSKQLSKIVGEDAEVTIQAVDGDLFGGLSASGLDEEGEVDYGRAFSTNAKIAATGFKKRTAFKAFRSCNACGRCKENFQGRN